MHVRLVSCVLAVGASLVGADAAMAQKSGPPVASSAVVLPADSGAMLYDLGRRLQNLEQQLAWRTDATSKNMLTQVNALQAKVFAAIPPTNAEYTEIALEISRLEFALQ